MRCKIIFMFFLAVFLVIPVYADVDLDEFKSLGAENIILTSDFEVSSSFSIDVTDSSYKISEVDIEVKLKPVENFQQEVISTDISSNGKETPDSFVFNWKGLGKENIDYSAKSRIKTNNQILEIDKKIHFPLKGSEFGHDIKTYLVQTDTIKSNDHLIINQASEIVQGEDDLYLAVVKIADWINKNIEYDLNTLTADSTKDAVWVLENREGVCDEITILFLSMLRSLNIPSRYSYGVSYSNLEQYNDFIPHAWAEVYFPDYGWIPFDVTYGQYGYIDSSHIKLGDSVGSNKSSVSYMWKGYGYNLETGELDMKTEILDYKYNPLNLIDLEIYPEKNNIGPDSYNLINVLIKNKKDQYIAVDLLLSKPEELDSYVDSKVFALKPYEEKLVGFIVKTPKEIGERVIYTYPILVGTSLSDDSFETEFRSRKSDPIFTKQDIDEIVEQNQEEKDKVYSTEVDFSCSIAENSLFSKEQGVIVCNVHNLGNVYLKDLGLCLKDDCVDFNLGITQKYEYMFEFFDNSEEYGNKEISVTLRNNEVFRKEDVKYVLLDEPKLEITNIDFPESIGYDKDFDINVEINKVSFSDPENIKFVLKSGRISRKQEIDITKTNIYMNFKDISSNRLKSGNNNINVFVYYEDKEGNKFVEEQKINIKLSNLSGWQKFKLFWIRLLRLY